MGGHRTLGQALGVEDPKRGPPAVEAEGRSHDEDLVRLASRGAHEEVLLPEKRGRAGPAVGDAAVDVPARHRVEQRMLRGTLPQAGRAQGRTDQELAGSPHWSSISMVRSSPPTSTAMSSKPGGPKRPAALRLNP